MCVWGGCGFKTWYMYYMAHSIIIHNAGDLENLYLNKTRDHGTLCHLFSVLGRLLRARKTSTPVLMLSQQFLVDMW